MVAARSGAGSARLDAAAASVRRAAERTFRKLRCGRLSVDVLVIEKRHAAALNRKFRGKREPAEILAFPLPSAEPGGVAGQICVCPPVAGRRAANIGRSRAGWLDELGVHAALHVLGFSHGTEAAAREMFSLQRSLVRCR